MPISVMENALSNAERRALLTGDSEAVPRPSDLYAALPSITGKMELEYEGELVGASKIARELIAQAASDTFEDRGGEMAVDELDEIVDYFDRGGVLQLSDSAGSEIALKGFGTVPGLVDAVRALGLERKDSPGYTVAACELVLEALVARRRLSRSDAGSYGRVARRPPTGGMGGMGKPTFEV
jgi:magnesium chelatase subunit I